MASGLLKRQLDDISECPICVHDYTDPCTLPCLHTYCRQCLETCCLGKQPGDTSSCPVCRAAFKVPSDGLIGLPKNFLIGKVMEVRDSTNSRWSGPATCACSSDDIDPVKKNVACSYCLECQVNLCAVCDDYHAKFKTTRAHKRFKLDNDLKFEELNDCLKHAGKRVELYCSDCKEVLCMICFIKSHNSHKCLDITEAADNFRHVIVKDVRSLTEVSCVIGKELANVLHQKKSLLSEISDANKEITELEARLKQSIDRKKNMLKVMEPMDTTIESLQLADTNIKVLNTDLNKLLRKGTAWELAQQVEKLHDRSGEILKSRSWLQDKSPAKTNNITDSPTPSCSSQIEKLSKSWLQDKSPAKTNDLTDSPTPSCSSQIEKLVLNKAVSDEVVKSSKPTLICTIPGGFAVAGVTSLSGRLYVVRSTFDRVIEVYDSSTFSPLQPVLIPSTSGVTSKHLAMTSCAHNNCLYVSNNLNAVHRVQLAPKSVKTWSVGEGPTGLSVNKFHKLIVTCRESNKLQEFTTDGDLVRVYSLPFNDMLPWHAIHMTRTEILVSYQRPTQNVSRVNFEGNFVCSFRSPTITIGKQLADGNTSLNTPKQLALLKSGVVIVADIANDKLVVMNSTLSRSCDLQLPIGCQLKGPSSLHLDESSGRLYVGEYRGGRVLVLGNVVGVDQSF